MKHCPTPRIRAGLLTACLLPLLASAQTPSLNYQVYSDPGGNVLRAHIWQVTGGEVFLETDTGRKLRLPISVFSAQSQGQIQAIATAAAPVAAPAPTPATPPPAGATNAPPPPITTAGLPPTTNPFPTPGASAGLPTGAPTPPIASTNPLGAPAAAGSNVDPTAILQEGAALLGHADFAKIAQSPFFQALKGLKPPADPDAPSGSDQLFGLSVEDITTVAICVPSLEGIDSNTFGSGAGNLPPGFKYAFAASFSKPINIEEANRPATSRRMPTITEPWSDPQHPPLFSELGGATLATAAPGTPDMPPNFCVALKNQGGGAIAIVGDRPSVEAALTNGQAKSATSSSSVFANLPAERDIWLTLEIPPSLAAEIAQEAAAGGQDDPMASVVSGLIQQLQSIGLALAFTDSAKINLFAQCKDAAGATNVLNALNGLVTMAKMSQQPGAPGGAPAFLDTLTINGQGTLVNASIQVTGADIGQLVGGLLMGGAGPGAGPPPGFDSSTSPAPPGFPSPGGSTPGGLPPTGTPMPAPGGTTPFPPAGTPTAPPAPGGNPFPASGTSTAPPTPATPPAPAAGGAVNPFAD